MTRDEKDALWDTALVAVGCWVAVVVISTIVKKTVVEKKR